MNVKQQTENNIKTNHNNDMEKFISEQNFFYIFVIIMAVGACLKLSFALLL